MMCTQELFYGDREPTWIISNYQDAARVYHHQEPAVYSQDVAPRYRTRYQRTHVRPEISTHRIHEDVPHYAETRYRSRVADPRYMPKVVELRVSMCCVKCEEKVKEALLEMEGVQSVNTEQYNQRVVITGFVDPMRMLKRVKKIKKKSEFVPQRSYHSKAAYDTAPKAYSHRPELSQVHTQWLPESATAYVQEFYNTPTSYAPSSYRGY